MVSPLYHNKWPSCTFTFPRSRIKETSRCKILFCRDGTYRYLLKVHGPPTCIWSTDRRQVRSDYNRLKLITEPDHYHMLNISDIANCIDKQCMFIKLDLLKGNFQLPVHQPGDVPTTASITTFSCYVFHHSTFGLRNGGATFPCMMDNMFGQAPHCLVYIDALLIVFDIMQLHEQHLCEVLLLLRKMCFRC